MPHNAIDRVAVTGGTRIAIAPLDGNSRRSVEVGNATPDDLLLDMGDSTQYIVVVSGGWHTFNFYPPTPQASRDGISFYAKPLASGTITLFWT